jgi:PAS domain S-box-containing protein
MASRITTRDLRAEIERLQRRVEELETSLAAVPRPDPEQGQGRDLARAILESAAEGIVVVGEDGRITLVNAKTEALFGYAREELVGQTLEILLPARLRGPHAAHRGTFFASPRARPMGQGLELAGARKDGSEFPVEISLSWSRTGAGLQAIAFVTDITERLAVERAARQAERLASLGSLSAGIAHEINNPIGIITSRIELMLIDAADHPLPAGVLDDLRVLHRNAMRVADIAQRFLSFARQSPVERSPVEIDRVVARTVELVQHQPRSGLRIVTALDAAGAPILGDASALEQVILNLIVNARDAMSGEGEIHIASGVSHDRPGRVWLTVADSGSGIAPETMSRIFDPFFTTKSSGTGLGLSVSYGIIRDHDGTVDVESTPGKGTSFRLTFPILAGDPA